MTNPDFARSLTLLRKERNISQRAAAKELGISQALLSHYENGIREPGLAFVVKACDYYGVSADFILGRTMARYGTTIIDPETMYDHSNAKDNVLRGSVTALLSKKLLVNSISLLFDLLGKLGNKEAVKSAATFLNTAVYRLYRHLYRAIGDNTDTVFTLSDQRFVNGASNADMVYAEVDYVEALSDQVKKKGPVPSLRHDDLNANYPETYPSLLQIVHTSGERINHQLMRHKQTLEEENQRG